ncbi:MAG TPA: zinc-binding dehydrogenase [Phycisphaerae bacterium]|nr:zinc-binding dehydrogenase [Phycisphaerae bacterium]
MPNILAAVMPGPDRPVELREIPQPDLEPDSALLAVEFSEVCGTDVHLQHGRLAGVPYPIVPGHVSVGHLEKIRGVLRDVHGRPFAEGDRVTFLDVHRTCHQCWYCLVAKASTRCPQRKVYGITYGLADGPCGGWADKVYLKPGTRCIRLDGVDSELFMAGGCSLPTALHAVERADLRFGDCALVLGAGPVGLSAVAFALLRGAGKVLCIGAPAHRLETAQAMGAAEVLDFTACDEDARREWVLEHTGGRGADVSIEATGAPEAVVQAIRWTRDAGCVVIVGQYTDAGEISLNPHLDVNQKHLEIRGCWGSDFSHFFRAIEMLKTPWARCLWSAVKLDRFTLSQTNEALDRVAHGRCIKALVQPRP